MDAAQIGNELTSIVLTTEQIDTRIHEIAAEIDVDYAGAEKPLLMVGVLKGAVMVMADLSRELRIPLEMDWMAVSSYGASTKSSGVVRIVKDLEISLEGRHVIIVEDIVDSTGAGDAYTAAFAHAILEGLSPVEAGRLANLAGALAATAIGAQGRLVTLEDLKVAAG